MRTTEQSEELAFDLFTYYFNHGLRRYESLRHFKLCDGSTTKHQIANNWSRYKREYREIYEQCKLDYYGDLGLSEDSILSKINDIATNGKSERNRLEALEYLNDFLHTNYRDELSLQSAATHLKIEIVGDDNETE